MRGDTQTHAPTHIHTECEYEDVIEQHGGTCRAGARHHPCTGTAGPVAVAQLLCARVPIRQLAAISGGMRSSCFTLQSFTLGCRDLEQIQLGFANTLTCPTGAFRADGCEFEGPEITKPSVNSSQEAVAASFCSSSQRNFNYGAIAVYWLAVQLQRSGIVIRCFAPSRRCKTLRMYTSV